ncbi:hypothetical protein STRAU_2447 [Streptomyces aurantiacus JA 4570]|uniref:Uncharacterized protein n=1 Tax=Streptomyces aurantiacus JA 4570 TaxID=1286094 RepID=S3ZNW2_9ACTN|nr:hypothetical protein STRAU_2447 [Streptomyces aurantiacus JA 4570]
MSFGGRSLTYVSLFGRGRLGAGGVPCPWGFAPLPLLWPFGPRPQSGLVLKRRTGCLRARTGCCRPGQDLRPVRFGTLVPPLGGWVGQTWRSWT